MSMLRDDALDIFEAAVSAVLPSELMANTVKLDKAQLVVAGHSFDLGELDNVIILGAGKASSAMALEVENILQHRITKGFVVTKAGHASPLKFCRQIEAGHPVPDHNSIRATEEIIQMVNNCTERDLVLLLLSGGASSLLADFPPGSSLEQVQGITELLLKCGADIHEINCVRKHVSRIKGGQLAQLCHPATVISLIISDVVGNDPAVIGSGPTVADPTTFNDAAAVLHKYSLWHQLPVVLTEHLQKGMAGEIPDTPKPGNSALGKVFNHIVGSNSVALSTAKEKALELGYQVKIISTRLQGNSIEAAREIIDQTIQYDEQSPACLLWSGETTVKVNGDGMGGRNQHLALASLIHMRNILSYNDEFPTILCAGTDGSDGPTDATGAIVDKETLIAAEMAALSVDDFFNAFDSYHFFELTGGQLITGPTQTNVMDLVVVLIP